MPTRNPSSPVRVVIVEDHALLRDFIALMLGQDPRFQVVAEVGSAAEAREACVRHQPGLLILDLTLPGESGLAVMADLPRLSPDTRVLICSGSVVDGEIREALRAHPHGFVEKGCDRTTLLEAIHQVAAGGSYYSAAAARLMREMAVGSSAAPASAATPVGSGNGKGALTPREEEVLRLVAAGQSTKQVAERLGVSEATAATHRANLMKKLGAHNASDLTRYALARGLVGVGQITWRKAAGV